MRLASPTSIARKLLAKTQGSHLLVRSFFYIRRDGGYKFYRLTEPIADSDRIKIEMEGPMNIRTSSTPRGPLSSPGEVLSRLLTLGKSILTREQRESPEWLRLDRAVQRKEWNTFPICLEVFTSHWDSKLTASVSLLLYALAATIRADDILAAEALLQLLSQDSRILGVGHSSYAA